MNTSGPHSDSDLRPATSGRTGPDDQVELTALYEERAEPLSAVEAERIGRIGRYRLDAILGEGGFGRVYLAFDEQLHRKVAIKVPHAHRIESQWDLGQFVEEARTVAQLEHQGVVPVHDVGHTDGGLCYVVSRFIDGENLYERIKRKRAGFVESAVLVESVARTLDFVHRKGIVHRDIKPGNILISREGRFFVADFGLASRDSDPNREHPRAGTVRYMSPEQVRGEGHLVDSRSDIFSLGVVLYELLTGQQPFVGDSWQIVAEQIIRSDPALPRHIDESIPRELERICMKALAKRSTQRYAAAGEMADDLAVFREQFVPGAVAPITVDGEASTQSGASSHQLVGILPRGLRSFEREDAHFFRELLAGPRDRDNLPDSLRFWKRRIEETDPHETFRLGLIYGPSGCGKSSFVKAGLLPILEPSVRPIFVEATADRTEARLLARLRREWTTLSPTAGLAESLASLRQQESEHKTLIIIDQFEQWLHATDDQEYSELARALRQCDGEHVQCILMIRDDFWLAFSRLMTSLEIELAQNRNMRLVDLFDMQHARRVLAEYGKAYARIPASLSELSREQDEFLSAAVRGLSRDDKVTPVRLALFAEMIKDRPWTPTTLKALGGTEGVGVRFLEECFDAADAPVERRVHQRAVHRTLRLLLPESGSDIKGAMRSHDELLAASGYSGDSAQFRQLLQILDTDLRLITPTDPFGLSVEESLEQSGERYYQLTHDFLVPAIRAWVTLHQRSTRRGRAELRLRERTAGWEHRRDSRFLPSWWESLGILALTDRARWTEQQKQMMSVATRRVIALTVFTIVLLVGGGALAWEVNGRFTTGSMVNQLETAHVSRVAGIIDNLDRRSRWAVPQLREARQRASEERPGSAAELYLNLALLGEDPDVPEYIGQQLLRVDPATEQLVCQRAAAHSDALQPMLWEVLAGDSGDLDSLSDEQTRHTRFRAALALAQFDPPEDDASRDRWETHARFVVDELLWSAAFQRTSYPVVVDSIRGANSVILDPLAAVMRDDQQPPARRQSATQLLVDLYADKPQILADVFLDADIDQIQQVLPILDTTPGTLIERLAAEIDQPAAEAEPVRRARRRSMAAALLLRWDVEDALSILDETQEPDARSYLVHRMRSIGVSDTAMEAWLQSASGNVRSGLLQALGAFDADEVAPDVRARAVSLAASSVVDAETTAVHSSARWLLGRWGERNRFRESLDDLGTRAMMTRAKDGSVMSRVDGPPEIGSFELATSEVTVAQFRRFRPDHRYELKYAPHDDCPVISTTWNDAIAYCRWLTTQDGLTEDDMCYPPLDSNKPLDLYPDYRTRRGYRLPTAAEWELACRAGTQTPLPFGRSLDLVEHYAWVGKGDEPTALVDRLKPNNWGFFGMLGNVREWCSDRVGEERAIRGERRDADAELIAETLSQGSFLPLTVYRSVGFRIARSAQDN